MSEVETLYDTKIKKLLQKFLEPNFEVKNDVYLNSLIKYLAGSADIGCSLTNTTLVRHEIIQQWIMEALHCWETTARKPVPNIGSFTINLVSILSSNEPIFVHLNCSDVFERLIKVIEPGEAAANPSIKLAYIKLLNSFLAHKSGLQFLIATNYWRDILTFSLENQTVYIAKEGHIFIAKLLDRVVNCNENFCISIIQSIVVPLRDVAASGVKNKENCLELRDDCVYSAIKPTILLIGDIFENYLEDCLNMKEFKVVNIFVKHFNLEQCINNYLMVSQNEEFVYYLSRICYLLLFFDFITKVEKITTFNADAVKEETAKLMKIFSVNITKAYVHNVMKLTYLGLAYWKNAHPKLQGKIESNCFENQLTGFLVIPVLAVTWTLYGQKHAEQLLSEDEFRDAFVTKLIKGMSQPTLRLLYQWRDVLLASTIFENAILGTSYIIKSKQYFTREVGATMFQNLIYCLKDLVSCVKEKPEIAANMAQQVNYVGGLLDAIAIYIEEFSLTWRDSVETICVMNISFDFLGMCVWSPRLVVKALKLVYISISKYMAPNMALLVDRINDSTMAFIGPLLYAKLHDSSWEVRDSALEVLCTISHNAHLKFPSFQKIVLDSELPSLVVKMSMKDGESFVRSTALKCLQEMTQVAEFWTDLLEKENLHEKMINILYNETEGIVRTQAASLMSTLYVHQNVPPHYINKIYDVMSYAATKDLHWEVKLKALDFWDKVMKNHLKNQGMIDGIFPTVTFSKENRKIVTLTEKEIQKRLYKILHQLSEIGCLAVLMNGVQDDCDIEVSKTATNITQKFYSLLKNHNANVLDENVSAPNTPSACDKNLPQFSPPNSVSMDDSSYSSAQSSPFTPDMRMNGLPSPATCEEVQKMSDDILDEIINSKDVTLLTGIYNPDDVDKRMNVSQQFKGKEVASPTQFLSFAQQDLEGYLEERKKWLSGIDDIGSLLDDMLKDYSNDGVNSMDCY